MAIIHTPFFDLFPKIPYDINRSASPNYEAVTNIFFRMAIIKNVLNNTSSYFVYDIDGDDTPEIVSEKVYGDSGAGWIVIYANEILDPQYEWVMSDQVFKKYLIGRYGSVETAMTTPHHYEKVIETTVDGTTTTFTHNINYNRLTENVLTVPETVFTDYFESFTIDTDYHTVDQTQVTCDLNLYNDNIVAGPINDLVNKIFNTYNINGQTVHEVTYVRMVTNYEYEVTLNDSRRQIKVIKEEYYQQIIQEFRQFVGNIPSYIRTVA